MNRIQNLKGFRDFLPIEAAKRKWLRDKLARICEQWGYLPLETPTLEPLEIFTGQIGDDEKLFFKFKDQGNRDVALRYDQTVPTCRFIGNYFNKLTFPFKRYQIQNAFRAEKPQKGRYREFLQVDADIFGVKTTAADAETIALSLDIYRQLGFKKAVVRINSRTLLKGIPYEAIISIDKIKKIGYDGVFAEMEQKGIPATDVKKYIDYVKNLQPNGEIYIIMEYLKNIGFPEDWYVFDPTIARSFSYSMGPIWEVELPEAAGLSVLGGERYDGLVNKLSGRDIGGTGFGLGFDRTFEAADRLGLIPEPEIGGTVLVTVFSKALLPNTLTLSASLRKQNISVDTYPNPDDKLDKQLKYANRKNIPYVIIQGPEEAARNTVKLKNMKTGEQTEILADKIVNRLI